MEEPQSVARDRRLFFIALFFLIAVSGFFAFYRTMVLKNYPVWYSESPVEVPEE